MPAARAAQLGNLTPVIGTLTAIGFLGERPSLLQGVGGFAILGGIALLLRGPVEPDRSGTAGTALAEEHR